MGFLQMKTLVLAGLLATSASAAVNSTPPPYTFLLRFPDGSLEVCPSTGFQIGFTEINVDVLDCKPDKVFGDAFGG